MIVDIIQEDIDKANDVLTRSSDGSWYGDICRNCPTCQSLIRAGYDDVVVGFGTIVINADSDARQAYAVEEPGDTFIWNYTRGNPVSATSFEATLICQ